MKRQPLAWLAAIKPADIVGDAIRPAADVTGLRQAGVAVSAIDAQLVSRGDDQDGVTEWSQGRTLLELVRLLLETSFPPLQRLDAGCVAPPIVLGVQGRRYL